MFIRGSYYVEIIPNHHLADKDGFVYVHRLNAEKKLGRTLKSTECVHHIDEDKFNNELDNLMVFKTNADHSAFHKGRDICLDGDVWVAIDKNIRIDGKNNKYNLCPCCHKNLKSSDAKVCKSCYELYYRHRKCDNLDKEKLLFLITHYSMTKIGEMYGVSDNAIRKWCKKYNLPFKYKDIKLLKQSL